MSTPLSIAASHPAPRPVAARDAPRVLVTGGSSGLGLALLREWQRRGAALAFVARRESGIASTLRELPGAHGIQGDVSRKDEIHRIALQALGALGGLDVLVNNASSLGPVPLAPLADTECEALEAALAANLLGPFRLTRALLGALAASARAGRGAVVLNVSSDAAVTPYPSWGAYGASKAALHHLSRIWHEELAATGVRVLSLDPGDMDTPLHALAVPDADPAALKPPAQAARELIAAVDAALAEGRAGMAVDADGDAGTGAEADAHAHAHAHAHADADADAHTCPPAARLRAPRTGSAS